MKVTGKVVDISKSLGGRYKLTVEVNETRDFENEIDEIKDLDKISIEVKKWREKRSLDANAYCWVLIGKIAEKLNISVTEVYRQHIRELGGNYTVCCVRSDAVNALRSGWAKTGVGWISDVLDSKLPNCTNVRLFYGSSTYDTAQMSRLIDNVVQDAKALGIQTETPEQIAMMKEAWDG